MMIDCPGVSGLTIALKLLASYWTRVLEINQIRGVEHSSFCISVLEENCKLIANVLINPAVRTENTIARGYQLGRIKPGLRKNTGF